MLEPKNILAVFLGNLHDFDLGGQEPLRHSFGDGVEKIINGPIKHLDEEGVFPQDPAVEVM